MTRRDVLRLLSLLIPLILAGPADGAPTDKQLDKLIEATQSRQHIDAFRSGYRMEFEEGGRGSEMPPAHRSAYRRAAEDVTDPERLLAQLRADLRSNLADGDAEAIIAFCQGELGKKANLLELRSIEPERMRELHQLRSTPAEITPTRRELILKMQGGNDPLRSMLDVALGSMEREYKASLGELPAPEKARQWLAYRREAAKSMRATMQEEMVNHSARVYQDLSDGELDALAEFFISPAGQRFGKVLQDAQADVYRNWLRRGEALRRER